LLRLLLLLLVALPALLLAAPVLLLLLLRVGREVCEVEVNDGNTRERGKEVLRLMVVLLPVLRGKDRACCRRCLCSSWYALLRCT